MIKENIQHFNSQEAAKILGVNVSTIKRWTDEGKLQCIKSVGGHRKFLMDHLAEFLHQNKKKTSKINLFPLENQVDLDISHYILKGNFEFLIDYIYHQAFECNRDRVQQVLNGLYLGQYPLYAIYDKLITPVLHKIGQNWSDDVVSIMDEHLATQTIRDSIVRLQGIIRIPKRKVGRALCLNPSLELHDIALKMVDHILESRGYQIMFSGQITPTLEIRQIFDRLKPDRLYISSTMISDPESFREEFLSLCDTCQSYGVHVYVGGQGFGSLDYEHPAVYKRLTTFEQVYKI